MQKKQAGSPQWLSLTGDQEVAGSIWAGSGNSLSQTDHEIFSIVILSCLLIQEEQLPVSGKKCTQVLVNRLED